MKRIFYWIIVLGFFFSGLVILPVSGQELPGPEPDPFSIQGTKLIFLPIISKGGTFFDVSGQVTDDNGYPLSGVEISNGAGETTTTLIDGSYKMSVDPSKGPFSFSPYQEEIGFAPTAMDLTVNGSVSKLDFTGMSGCGEMIGNGGFETDSEWELQNASYISGKKNSGDRSLLLGLPGPINVSETSVVMSPVIQIPLTSNDPQLHLWIFTQSISNNSHSPSVAGPADNFFGPDADPNDIQAIQVLSANGQVLETLWQANGANSQEWVLVQYNLYQFSGQYIRIGFMVKNDGLGSNTSLFVDDVSLQTCPTIFSPEEYTQDANSPESPDACMNQVVNPGFKSTGGWGIPYTAYSAGFVDRFPYSDEVYLGSWAIRTGIPVYAYSQNRYSYSDFWQTVYIPNSASTALLTFYNRMANSDPYLAPELKSESDFAETEAAFAEGSVWGQEPLSGDWMYVLVLNPYTGTILKTLAAWDGRNNSWKYRQYDLSEFRGQNIRIQLGTYNNGWDNVQSMYVDEIYVTVCDGVLPPPPAAITCPTGYSERLVNNSFEGGGGWYRPITAYSARFINGFSYTGLRSMQTGIINPWHNRYSYSDFGQSTVVPNAPASAILKFYAYMKSGDYQDKQYLLVLNNWGYWIDTLLWQSGGNTAGWVEVTRDLRLKSYNGWPIKLQWGTYNNGWGGVTSMFIDDVTLCTYP